MSDDELRPLGPGRYAFTMATPWGQEIPAELIMATPAGWRERPESRDPRWSAYEVGPIILAIRLEAPPIPAPAKSASVTSTGLAASRCAASLRLPFSMVPAEWN